ncbi:MAG: hypothetical protein IJH64_00925 [Oscillospiraceae bacterium]|nr:hypothetical protein [Oscillospiraceae bacterium]
MTLEEAMREIFYHGFVFTLRPKKALEALKVIRKTLLDYKQLKSDYIELDNQIRKANTENDELHYELKRANEIIRFQKEEFDRLSQRHNQFVQAVAEKTLFEPMKLVIDKETAKRMKLIGGDSNAEN